jgi:hypothetical protein
MSRGTLVAGLQFAAVVTIFLSAGPSFAQSREPAGHILWAFGQVERIGSDGAAMPLAKGHPVFEGDVIRTAPGSSAQLIMSDEALIALRAESSVKLDKYRYRGAEDGTEAALLQLLKGGLRSITGAIGRTNKDSYQLKNDGHVIGIRGTDHETYATESGTFNRVTLGGTYLQSSGGRVDLAPGEVGFVSLLPGSAPSRLERTPEFMHLAALGSGRVDVQPRERAASDESRPETNAFALPSPAAAPMSRGAAPMGRAAAAPMGAAAQMGVPAAALPVLPSRGAAQPSGGPQGFGSGGRCAGPCSDAPKGNAAPAR